MTRTRRWARRALAALAGLILAAAAATALIISGTVPPMSGTLALAGLEAPVRIVRDSHAVPHVFASSVADLYRGLGFVHAQDRLWQMESMRRAAQGRLSEIFGERTLDADIFLRTLDLYGHAERSFARFPPEVKSLLDAYAEGVNGYLERRTRLLEGRLAPEFLLLRHRPEPWRGADSVAIVKMMALNLSANLNAEIRRLTLAAQGLMPGEIDDVMPPDRSDASPPLPDLSQLLPLRRLAAARSSNGAAALEVMFDTGASNSWVVGGTRTATGKPMLANDPHLRLSAPSIWYLAHLALERDGRATNAAGASLPGTPVIVLGRGDTIAWGFTNAEADVQDLFIEKINPDNPSEYLAPDGWRRFETEQMEFRIRGGGVRTVERRRTRHGPVLPASFRNLGQILQPGHVAALQWTALSDDDTTITAGLFDPGLRTVADYIDRTRRYVVPMQAIVVADAEGGIAMIAPGRIPVRRKDNAIAGRAPVPGWDSAYDWEGSVPFEALPRDTAPPAAAIGTANARIVDNAYPHLITHDWEDDFRIQRIRQIVLGRERHDMDTMRAAQLDDVSLAFSPLKTLMIAATRSKAGRHDDVLDLLDRWDAAMAADRPEPLIFMAWLREAVRAIYSDDLGAAFTMFFRPQARAMTRLLSGEAHGRDWCDDRTTPEQETCGDILARSLTTALSELEERHGRDTSRWSWGEAHRAHGEHQVFGSLPVIGRMAHVGAPSPGGPYTLNRGVVEFGSDQPFANRHASTYRAIYDLEDLDRSLYVQATGQSGNPFSRYYRTFEEKWARGDYIRISTRPDEIVRGAVGTWRLEPAPPSTGAARRAPPAPP